MTAEMGIAAGTAKAWATIDYMAFKHGSPLDDTQHADDARQHPDFERFFAEECYRNTKAGALPPLNQ